MGDGADAEGLFEEIGCDGAERHTGCGFAGG